jgi:hypothetical protein
MNVESKLARTRLQNAAQTKDKTRRRRWLMIFGAIALLALVSFATIDYWLLLSLPLRYATSALLAMGTGLGGWVWRGLFRRPTSLKEAALDAETLRQETDCIVSTAAEYASGKTQATNAYEPELAAALQTVAAQRLGTVQMPYTRTLRGPLAVLGTALTALVIFIVFTPGAWTALKRISLPWLKAQYTQVEVKPRDVELPFGQAVQISGMFFGRPPKDPRLQWQAVGDPAWQTASMTQSSDGPFVHSLENVTIPVKYRVSGGDAISPEFQVTPYIPPEVKYFSVDLAHPGYTRIKPLAQSPPDITILRGSTATVHLRANVNLSRARLWFSDTNMAPVELGLGENELWTGHLKIARDTDYRIELFDEKGRRGADDTLHHIVATADNPPQVEILEPGQDLRAEATNRIPVKVSAVDDYGVTEIKVVYHKLNSGEQTVVCQTESVKNGEWIATAEIDLATLDLKRYDVVAYHAEAGDNNTLDGPSIGRSPLYFIEITDKESAPTPPPQPVPGEQVNLLVVQKQILADTVALNLRSAATNYLELALRQTNAVELGRLYLQTMAAAPPEAITEMTAAIASMEQAIAPLSQRDKATAVPREEAALAHLYQVLALLPDLKMLAVKPKPQLEQKPQMAVALREIKKPPTEPLPVDPEIEKALDEARELSRAQAELNELGQKLAKAGGRGENAAQADQAKGEGQGNGQGQGEGEGKGEGEGHGKGNGEKPPEKPEPEKQLARNTNDTNSVTLVTLKPPTSQTNKVGSTNDALQQSAELTTEKPAGEPPKQTQPAKNSGMPNAPMPRAQFAQAQNANGQGTKPGKGRGKGKGKAKAAGQKGNGKGQGTKPGDGSGQPSAQQNGQGPEMADHPTEPDTPEELAQKEEELSTEAKALGEMLQRLAGQGTRVGHNLARSANKAAEHMEGAAMALKQGNASGAGRRGTMSSAELERLVTELERLLGQRPDPRDVASEEAPKEYEAFISEYFRKLSYEK